MRTASPTPRLRHASPGDTVKLSGLPWPLFHGGELGGYALLYRSEKSYLTGKPWESMACLSHEIVKVET